MHTIFVTAQQLLEIRDSLNGYSGQPYALAYAHGFQGFASALDHIEDRPWSFDLIDRGVPGTGGNWFRSNSTRFAVMRDHRFEPVPLREYC
jgi:hypothetical protein